MLPLIQLIIAILLIVTILLQQRGSGLGAAFGGEGSVYRTKRGAEKVIFTFTIILAILFLGLALINVYLNSQTSEDNQLPIESGEPGELLGDKIFMEGEKSDTEVTNTEEDSDTPNIFKLGEPEQPE